MSYADGITSTHTSMSAAKKCIHTKSRQNNVHSVHSRPCRIYKQSGPQNKQHCTTHGNAPIGSGSYLILTYSTHIHNIPVHAHNPLQIIKTLIATRWGKQKETLYSYLPCSHETGPGVCFHMVLNLLHPGPE